MRRNSFSEKLFGRGGQSDTDGINPAGLMYWGIEEVKPKWRVGDLIKSERVAKKTRPETEQEGESAHHLGYHYSEMWICAVETLKPLRKSEDETRQAVTSLENAWDCASWSERGQFTN
ncbi:hypothetical protein XELAEV_18006259mg [Xenopus laevis]|uniref:Uncharacterized protein n=1 Tax=Xenopus laevis TaxID=8355 RepID=A0A974DZU0_XENLA|nr:hypothetical protein XELAEV_18006259mg [Xenopus laevis]